MITWQYCSARIIPDPCKDLFQPTFSFTYIINGMRILVAEDEHRIANAIKKGLEQEHYAADVAYDGNEAVDFYRKYKPDLITLDITMPNKDGQQAMKEILAEFPNANILMVSAVRGDAMLECINLGAKGYIEKPLRFNENEFVNDFKETIDEIFAQL